MRKLLSLIACLAILMPVAAQPAYAAWPVNGDCDHFTSDNFFGFVARGGSWPTSIYAQMYGDDTRFQPCTNPWPGESSFSTQWIALQPNSGHGNIVQVGYIKCNSTDNPSCKDANGVGHANQLGYFWAYGNETISCPGYPNRLPYGTWLGAVPLVGVPPGPGYHDFQITRSRTNDFVYIFIDGVVKASVDSAKICWVQNSTNLTVWSAERTDPNDGFGGPGPVYFQNMKYATNLGSLVNTNFVYPSACNLDPEFNCFGISPTKVGFSTTQQ